MLNRFKHPTYGAVTMLRNFGHYAVVDSVNGRVNVNTQDLQPLDDPIPFPSATVEDSRTEELEQPIDTGEEETDQGQSVNTVRLPINKANANQISKELPNVAKVRAKRIIENRPEGGYTSFSHLQQVLPDLFGDSLESPEWVEIEPLISYET